MTRQSSGPGRARRDHFDIATPVAGYYRRKLVKGGVWMPVRIWFGPPPDPVTGEPLDRSPRWQATDGETIMDAHDVWTHCCHHPISEAEYRYLIADRRWCRENAPDAPEAKPRKPVDLHSMKPLF